MYAQEAQLRYLPINAGDFEVKISLKRIMMRRNWSNNIEFSMCIADKSQKRKAREILSEKLLKWIRDEVHIRMVLEKAGTSDF